MPKYPFEHNGPVFLISDDDYEVAYYARNGKKYKCVRQSPRCEWDTDRETEIDDDHFWMVVACIERKPRRA